jgi:hypothetical protein
LSAFEHSIVLIVNPKASFDIVENPPKDCPKRTISKNLRNVAENTVIYRANGNFVVTVDITGSASSHEIFNIPNN